MENVLKKLAEISDSLDKKGAYEEADVLDDIIVTAAKEEEEEEEEENGKITGKQRAALKALYNAGIRCIDLISVGKKEFPDKNNRQKVSKLMNALEDTLDSIEGFGPSVVSEKEQEKRED